jgi:ubiquinone/menaquinone biosynthesis C-methylase UbiE
MPEVVRLQRISNTLQRWITPGLRYSQATLEERLRAHVPKADRWLDLGCGHRVLSEWRADAEADLVRSARFALGIDTDFDALCRHRSFTQRCVADISALPFPSGSFDLVTANMVVEHLADPFTQFFEIARVLTRGGAFVFHTPNAQSYVVAAARLLPDAVKKSLARILEDRVAADVYPTHYRANKRSAIEQLSAQTGLVLEQIEFVSSSPALSLVPPLLILELLWIRQLQRRPALAKYRPTLICTLRKPS